MAKKKAAKAGAGAIAAGQAARNNDYVQRLIEDESLRDDLRAAFESARKAYDRIEGKGPQKALDDKKVQKELREAATSLKSASDSLRSKPKRSGGKGKLLLLGLVGAGLAIGLSEGLRNKVLDALFGAEEEFEYTSSTTSNSGSAAASTEKVGS